MKFVTSQNSILKALMLVFGGIAKTLEHSVVKINTQNSTGLVTLETKNLDVKINSFFKAEIAKQGEVYVDFIKLNEIVKKLSSAFEVSIELQEGMLHIQNGKSKFSLKTTSIAKEERPEGIGAKEETVHGAFTLMSKQVLLLIDKTKFSIYPDGTRFNLNGLLFQFKQEGGANFLTAVSTDGHRLSFCKLEVNANAADEFPKITVPKKSTLELRKILDQVEDEEVEVSLLKNHISISSPSFKFVSNLIDANFPEYEKVIPQENTKLVTIERKPLIGLIERVCAIHTQSSENGVRLVFEKNLLTIVAKNKDAGEAVDEITMECNFEGRIEVNYNYHYLIEILSHVSSEKVNVYLKDEKTSALIKDEKLDSYFYILMPMRS